MNKKKISTSEEIFNDIEDSLVENEVGEHASPRRYLESQGVDVDSLLDGGIGIVNQWRNKARLQARRKQYEVFRSHMTDFMSKLSQVSPSQLREQLAALLAGDNKKMAAVYWHKLEDITDSDLSEMLKEQQLLEYFMQVYEGVSSEHEDR